MSPTKHFFGHVRGRMLRACVCMCMCMVGEGRLEGGESSSCHVWPQFVSDLLRYSYNLTIYSLPIFENKNICAWFLRVVSGTCAVICYIVRI